MNTTAQLSPGIRAFSGQVQEAASSAILDLLRAVDETVDALARVQRSLAHATEMAHWLIGVIMDSDRGPEIDPEDEIDGLLEQAANATRNMVEGMKIRLRSARGDTYLQGDHEQVIVSEYEACIAGANHLAGAIEQIRTIIKEHDADLSPLTGPFKSAEALIAALNTDD